MIAFRDPATLRHTLPANNVDDNLRAQLKKAAATAQPADPLKVMKAALAQPRVAGDMRKGAAPGSELLAPTIDATEVARANSRNLISTARPLGWGAPRPPEGPAPLTADGAKGELVATGRVQRNGPVTKITKRDSTIDPREIARKAAALLSPLTRAAVNNLRSAIAKGDQTLASEAMERIVDCPDDHEFSDLR